MNIIKKCKRGLMCYSTSDTIIGKSLYTYGEYSEGQTIVFSDFIKESDVAVDAGANCGYFTLIFSRIVGNNGKVFAYEPQKRMFYRLCATVSINNLDNVECYQNVLSDKNEIFTVPDTVEKKDFNYSGINLKNYSNIKDGIKVSSIRIDDCSFAKLNFLKISVESMEINVLNGAIETINKCRPIVYLRADKKEQEKECREFFSNKNYICCCLTSGLFNENNFYNTKENILKNDQNQSFIVKNLLCVPSEKKEMIPELLMAQIKHTI